MNLIETQERTFKEFKDAVSQANEKVDKIYSKGVDAIDLVLDIETALRFLATDKLRDMDEDVFRMVSLVLTGAMRIEEELQGIVEAVYDVGRSLTNE